MNIMIKAGFGDETKPEKVRGSSKMEPSLQANWEKSYLVTLSLIQLFSSTFSLHSTTIRNFN